MYLMLRKPLVTARRTNSFTARKGLSTGSFPSPFMPSYSNASVLAACAAASASTSHRALLTAAAAAKADERIGKADTSATSPAVPYRAEMVSRKGSSTVAAVAAAQKAERAEVKGRMAEFLAP